MTNRNSDKMANMPVGKLLYSMSLPAVFSMLIQALYNIVDTMYVSRLGSTALFAIGLVYPLQMIALAIGLGGSAGVSTVISRRLGAKRYEDANRTCTTGALLTFIHYLFVAFVGVFLSKAFLSLFTKDAVTLQMGHTYLLIVMGLSFGQAFSLLFEKILQSTGNMIIPMFTQLLGAITNIILDPIMIFGWFGVPAMGIAGAAIATVIGQVVACLFIMFIFFTKDHEVEISFKKYKPNMKTIKSIYEIGLPVMVMNALGSVTTTAMNSILVKFTDVAVSALAVYFKLQSFVFMPAFGFNQGVLPILSYNFGAKNKERYMGTLKYYVGTVFTILVLGTVLFMTCPHILLGLFDADADLLLIGTKALRIISIHFGVAALTICMMSVFQSLRDGTSAMFVSILRQLGFLIPCAFVLGKIGGLDAVWFAYPIAETAVCLIFLPLALKKIKTAFIYDND